MVIVTRLVADAVRAERARYSPLETGGFLIGIRRGPHLEVTGLTTQGAGDVGTLSSFERRCSSHRKHIHERWRYSHRIESLVGDWHSHPLGDAGASNTDHAAWQTVARASRQAIVGLIEAGVQRPRLFQTTSGTRSCELLLTEQDERDLVFTYQGYLAGTSIGS